MRFTLDPKGPPESSAIRIKCRARCVAPDLHESGQRLGLSRATQRLIASDPGNDEENRPWVSFEEDIAAGSG